MIIHLKVNEIFSFEISDFSFDKTIYGNDIIHDMHKESCIISLQRYVFSLKICYDIKNHYSHIRICV